MRGGRCPPVNFFAIKQSIGLPSLAKLVVDLRNYRPQKKRLIDPFRPFWTLFRPFSRQDPRGAAFSEKSRPIGLQKRLVFWKISEIEKNIYRALSLTRVTHAPGRQAVHHALRVLWWGHVGRTNQPNLSARCHACGHTLCVHAASQTAWLTRLSHTQDTGTACNLLVVTCHCRSHTCMVIIIRVCWRQVAHI